jgi:hypothetical protein
MPDRAAIDDERTTIVSELARYLYDAEDRLDPGNHDICWDELNDFMRAFYVELVWILLSRKSKIMRFFELTDSDHVARSGIATE